MLDEQGDVIEGCYSNLLVCKAGQWLTPMLDAAGVNGVIRQWLRQQLVVTEARLSLDDIKQADALVLSNSLMGIVPIVRLDNVEYSPNHETLDAMKALQSRLESLF